LDFEIHLAPIGEFTVPGPKSLINGDEVAFANGILAIGIAGDVLEQRLTFAAHFSDLGVAGVGGDVLFPVLIRKASCRPTSSGSRATISSANFSTRAGGFEASTCA
jgi:hypothetical protein